MTSRITWLGRIEIVQWASLAIGDGRWRVWLIGWRVDGTWPVSNWSVHFIEKKIGWNWWKFEIYFLFKLKEFLFFFVVFKLVKKKCSICLPPFHSIVFHHHFRYKEKTFLERKEKKGAKNWISFIHRLKNRLHIFVVTGESNYRCRCVTELTFLY